MAIFIEIITAGGIGSQARRVRIPITQMLTRRDDGTLLCVTAAYGADEVLISRPGDEDWESTLQGLNIRENVTVQQLHLPPVPSGARLLTKPGKRIIQ